MNQSKTAQQSSISKMFSHPHISHFLIYCLTYIIFGQVLCGLGPMFPYLAAHQNHIQTQYSFLFTCRAFGFITGSVLVKYIHQRLSLHGYIVCGIGLQAVFSMIFNSTQNIYLKGFIIYLVSIGGSFQDININLSSLVCFKGNNLSVWLQAIHGCFGIGGLIGPFVVYIFQLNTMKFLGICSFALLILYYFITTPQNMKDTKQIIQNNKSNVQQQLDLPNKSIILICLCFFCAVGQQCSYGGWISSYAVLYNFSSKQHATFYSSLYWISITAFRFILAFIQGKPSYKINILAYIGIITSFISYYFIFYVHSQFGLIFMSIMYGINNSVLFPLLLTIPQQFGYKLTQHQGSLFLMSAAMGQGCWAVGVGKMMQWFSYNWLIYSALIINIFLVGFNHINHQFLENTKINNQNEKNNNLEKFLKDRHQGNYSPVKIQLQMSPMSNK